MHLDVKKANICFSKELNKNVFIDFGLSRLIQQEIGEKTWTTFTGTLNYCSEEMKKCYILQSKLLVDLYQNDWHALQKTCEEFVKKETKSYPQISNIILNREEATDEEKNADKRYRKQFMEKLVNSCKLKFHFTINNIGYAIHYFLKYQDLPKTCL